MIQLADFPSDVFWWVLSYLNLVDITRLRPISHSFKHVASEVVMYESGEKLIFPPIQRRSPPMAWSVHQQVCTWCLFIAGRRTQPESRGQTFELGYADGSETRRLVAITFKRRIWVAQSFTRLWLMQDGAYSIHDLGRPFCICAQTRNDPEGKCKHLAYFQKQTMVVRWASCARQPPHRIKCSSCFVMICEVKACSRRTRIIKVEF